MKWSPSVRRVLEVLFEVVNEDVPEVGVTRDRATDQDTCQEEGSHCSSGAHH